MVGPPPLYLSLCLLHASHAHLTLALSPLQALYLLFESANGFGLFERVEAEEIGKNAKGEWLLLGSSWWCVVVVARRLPVSPLRVCVCALLMHRKTLLDSPRFGGVHNLMWDFHVACVHACCLSVCLCVMVVGISSGVVPALLMSYMLAV